MKSRALGAKSVRRLAFLASLLLAPVAWSPGEGLTSNDACADDSGTCCKESGPICYVGEQSVPDAYYNGDNRCPKPAEQ